MEKLVLIARFIKYYIFANSRYGIHSPFIYKLVNGVFRDKKEYNDYTIPELLRKELLSDNRMIDVTDLGAIEVEEYASKRSINSIAKSSLKPPKYAKLLYRLVKHFQPETLLELGTSLGVSTIYHSLAVPKSKIITIEGCENIASLARRNFNRLENNNIEILVGNIDDVLPELCAKTEKFDYVFFDGNHRKEATINYFEQCIKKAHNDSIFVFDDIRWSKGMEEAWNYIREHDKINVTLDLFFMGIVFFRKEMSKQHFNIRY